MLVLLAQKRKGHRLLPRALFLSSAAFSQSVLLAFGLQEWFALVHAGFLGVFKNLGAV